MRFHLVFIFLICGSFCIAQQTDTLSGLEVLFNQSKLKEEGIKHERSKLTNYYGPFHQTIKDSSVKTISDIDIYLSCGVGSLEGYAVSGWAGMLSGSFAYKSHLLSVTYDKGVQHETISGYRTSYPALVQESCYGILLGECIRYKHGMLSLSTGIALAGSSFSSTMPQTRYYNYYPNYSKQGIISLPIELKAFVVAYNGIGLGIHFTETITFHKNNSPIYF